MRFSERPVLYPQPLAPPELPRICRDQNQVAGQGLSGDQRVVFADALASPLQIGADFTRRLRILPGR
jgi:hypothetical protein